MAIITSDSTTTWYYWTTTNETDQTAIWTAWHTTSSNTTSVTAGDIWLSWNSTGATTYVDHWTNRPDIPIDREAMRRAEEATRKAARRRQRLARLASARAERLLKEVLNDEQRKQWKRDRSFVVHGRLARYRLRPGRTGNVDVIDRDGRITHRLCAHPAPFVPDADTLVAQKMWLEVQEEEFLRIANRHPIYGSPQPPVLPPLH